MLLLLLLLLLQPLLFLLVQYPQHKHERALHGLTQDDPLGLHTTENALLCYQCQLQSPATAQLLLLLLLFVHALALLTGPTAAGPS